MQKLKGLKYYKTRDFDDLKTMLLQSISMFGENEAFVFRDTPDSPVRKKTYTQFYEDMSGLGTSILKSGLKGKKIAVIGENSYAWCLAYMSVVCSAGISVPLDRLLPEEEILSLIERSKTDAVIYDAAFHDTMVKVSRNFPDILFIAMNSFRFNDLPEEFSREKNSGNSKFILMDDLINEGRGLIAGGDKSFEEVYIDPEKMMSLLYTSGTTSKSKAVMLSHKNVCADIKGLAEVVKFRPKTRMLSVLPLHHTFENTCGLACPLYFGLTIFENDGLRYIQKNMQEYKINCIIGVPLLFQSFYSKIKDGVNKQGKDKTLQRAIKVSNILRKAGIDLRKKLFGDILKKFGGEFNMGICGAAPINPEIIKFFDDIGIRILQGYGLTETSPVVAGCNSRVFVPGSVGHPLSGVEIAIDNETDGLEGEILVKGDIVMMGYYEDNDSTENAIDKDGWLHTGDVGRIDPKNNCLYITGRLKSMIVMKSGKKIFPEELEHIIGQFSFVRESLVWGESNLQGDVDVWARVVLDNEILESEGIDINDEQSIKKKLDMMLNDLNKKMPSFKSVKYIIFGEKEMEKTTTKKIKRNLEIDSVRKIIAENKIKFRQAAGKNIDILKNRISAMNKSNDDSGESKNAPEDKKLD